MRWRRHLRHWIGGLARGGLGHLLTAVTLALGAAAVTVLLALGAGTEQRLRGALEQLGRNLLVVNAGRTTSDALRGGSRQVETLTAADARAIAELVVGVERAVPVASGARLAIAGRRQLGVTVLGSTPQLRPARNYRLIAGRFLSLDDLAEARRMAVVGADVPRELFEGELPLGATLRLGGAPFRIVGVLERKGVGPDGSNPDDRVIIPLTTARRRLLQVDYLDRILVQAGDRRRLPAVETAVRRLLRRRHGLIGERTDDFETQDQAALLAAQDEAGTVIGRLAAGLATVTLGLGGAGLFAVALLSVRGRYEEIGLRRAVGARRRDILGQFLAETLLLAGAGALAGLGAGSLGVTLAQRWLVQPLALTWSTTAYPLAVCLAVALVAGLPPALRAARLDPIDALRSGGP